MHRFFFHRLGLCDEQGEAPLATSGAPAEPQTEDDAAKLTIGQRISAALASKESLQTKILEQTTKLAEQAATIETLTAQLAEANAKVAKLEADAAEVATALHAAEAEAANLKATAKTAAQLAKEQVASLGFPAAQLPAASQDISGEDADEKITALRAKIASTKDPTEKGRLVMQIRQLTQDASKN